MDRTNEKGYWEFIWDKFKAGDRRAFELIYLEFVDALFSYGSRITPHHALLEDAIQDTFLAVYTYGGSLRKPESLEFYLYKTLRHIIIRKLKEKYRFIHPNHFPESFNLKFPIEESVLDEVEENLVLLKKELGFLDSNKRELIFLRFNSGLTYNEIEIMDHYAVLFEYPDNRRAFFSHSWMSMSGSDPTAETVHGTGGAIDLKNGQLFRRVVEGQSRAGEEYVEGYDLKGDMDYLCDQEFFECHRTGKKPFNDFEVGNSTILTGLLGRKAIYEQKVVT